MLYCALIHNSYHHFSINEALNVSAIQEETISRLESLVQILEQKIDHFRAQYV